MKNLFYIRKVFVGSIIAALCLFGCEEGNHNKPATPATSNVTGPSQSEKPSQNPGSYHLTEKTYNGQKISLLSVNDYPLRGIPLATLRKDAATGDAAAQYELGRRLGRGEGVTRDLQKSLEWVRKAAQKNYAEAQFELATMYSLGVVWGKLKKSDTNVNNPI